MELDRQGFQARDAIETVLHSFSLLAQLSDVLAIDAHHHRLLGPGQNFPDTLLQIGLDIAIEAGIAVNDFLQPGDRLLIID